jgi:hypothetical protein
MQRRILSVCTLTWSLAAGLTLWPACHGGTAGVSELPPPEADDRPPGSAPELPGLSVDLPTDRATSSAHVLGTNRDFQNALDAAKPGEVITLKAGATFTGPFTLPKKDDNGWITIRTSTGDGVFPPPGTRVTPSNAPLMPIIESGSGPAITAGDGVHHFRFIGIHVRPRSGVFVRDLIALGDTETAVEALPHHIVFERCYIHGDPGVGGRRGFAMNSRYTAVVDSYVSDFKEQGADSQAIACWNGLGPFKIVNNYLEGAGENLIFGGGDPSIKNLVPADIEIRRNVLAKPLAWKQGEPSYAGTQWSVKNLFELKNARRVLVDGNVFENNWLQSQSGFAILFTPRNQDGNAPWSGVRDVTFTHNIVRHTGSGIDILGTDDLHPSLQTKRILIRGNLFEDVDGAKWGGAGTLFQVMSGTADVVIDHNTGFQNGSALVGDGAPNTGFAYTNNLTSHSEYGVGGTSTFGNPMLTLTTFFPSAPFAKNVLIGKKAAYTYPPDNFFPASTADVGFVDFAGGNYRLTRTSAYKRGGTDKNDIGADIDALAAATTSGAGSMPRRTAGSP